jgi:alpha-beta hydrolase superfamily lysophospholipase
MDQVVGSGPKEESFDSTKGAKIFLRSWQPAGAPRAVVVLCHGFKSHGGQYLWSADQLAAAGYAVYALDLRGRGNSSGERFYVEHVDEYVDDVAATIRIAKQRAPGLPVFLLGHSAGGVISCTYALDHQSELAGLICESFAFRVPAPQFALNAIKGLSRIAPRLRILDLKPKDFTRDPAALAELNADPLIAGEVQPAITVAALWRADQRLEKEFPTIKIPVLIMHGTQDKATMPAGSQMFYEKAGSKDKTLKLYEGHFHDLLNDIGKEGVMADVKAWIDSHLPAK